MVETDSSFSFSLGILSRNVNEVGARLGIDFFFSGFIGLFGMLLDQQHTNEFSTNHCYSATPIAGALLTTEYHWA